MQPTFPQEPPQPKLGNPNKLGLPCIYTTRATDDAVIPEIMNISLNDYLLDCSGVKEFHKTA